MDRFDKQLIENIEKKEKEYNELNDLLESVEIMTDNKLFHYYQKKQKKLVSLIECYTAYKKLSVDYSENNELIKMESDEEIIKSLIKENERVKCDIDNLFITLKTEFNKLKNVKSEKIIIELNYKSGDVNYLSTIFEIFDKCKNINDFEILDITKSNESIVFEMKGDNIYQNLKYLSGNIKVIFEGNESIFYLVILKSSDDGFIFNEDDVKIETLKSGGAGGQHINKTESAIRLTHIPTGLSVMCQDERSQLMNKKRAFENLELKLKEKFEKESKNDIIKQRKNIKNALFSSTPAMIINYDKNNVFCNKTQKYYKLNQVINGNLQIIWSDVFIDGTKN